MTASDGHVLDQLSAFMDGDLRRGAEAAVRAHLSGCASCARAAAELRAIIGAARSFDRPEPPPTLWPSIEGALARQDDVDSVGGLAGLLRWRPFAFGTLAGATVALALAWAGASWFAGGPSRVARPAASPVADAVTVAAREAPLDPLLEEAEAEFARAAAAYERSIEKLRALLARQEPRWSDDARAVYAGRLARLDEAISRSRELARRRPGDSAGNEMLFAAYQEKIQFLAAAVHRGAPGPGGGGP